LSAIDVGMECLLLKQQINYNYNFSENFCSVAPRAALDGSASQAVKAEPKIQYKI